MIHYLDRNRVKKFALRSSMRALEEDLLRHGLVRCHRSYSINPHFIKMVRRDESTRKRYQRFCRERGE